MDGSDRGLDPLLTITLNAGSYINHRPLPPNAQAISQLLFLTTKRISLFFN